MELADDDTLALQGELSAEAELTLLEHRNRFLAALERMTHRRDVAEDILQAAYIRALERGTPAVGEENVVAWFSTVLRNAWFDVVRRAGVEASAAHRIASEAGDDPVDDGLHDALCACVHDVIRELKPDYARMLLEVDLRDRPVGEVAREAGITSNNAGVRLHRARQALGRQLGRLCGACAAHGCLDCSCRGT